MNKIIYNISTALGVVTVILLLGFIFVYYIEPLMQLWSDLPEILNIQV